MGAKQIIIIVTAVLASLLEILDVSIVNVAVPSMMGNLGATLDEISWVSTGYMIANSIILPVAAWFAMKLGRKRYFTGAIAVFTGASLACGLAPNLPVLIFFRILQGLAGGALLPTSQTLIQEQFPKEKATLAMAIFGMSVMIGPALGPVLGGYLTDNLGWRAIFNVNLPVGLIAATLSYLNVGEVPVEDSHAKGPSASKKERAVDWGGFALLSLGIGCFQYLLERGETEGWFDSNAIRASAVLAAIGVVAFVLWELRVASPIMNLRLFRSNAVSAGSVMMLALGVMLYALTFAVPIFSDNVMHLTATQTGILFIPGSLATAAAMMAVGGMSKHVHPRAIIIAGISIAVVSVYMLTRFTTATGSHDLLLPLILRGVASGFLFISISGAVMGQFRGEELAQVSGMMNFFRQIGGSIGIASLSTLLTRFGKQNYADMMGKVSPLTPTGYHDLVSTAAGLSGGSLHRNVGMGDPAAMAIKALWGRAQSQVFIMSFDQLCWIILFIVLSMLVPLFFMKMDARVDAPVDIH